MTAYTPHHHLLPHHTGHLLSRPSARSARLFTRMTHAITGWIQRIRDERDLYEMSASELQDLGITRSDIPRVFGPEFAREYKNRGDYPAAARRR